MKTKNKFILRIDRGCEIKSVIRHQLTEKISYAIMIRYPENALRGCDTRKEAVQLQNLIYEHGGLATLLENRK